MGALRAEVLCAGCSGDRDRRARRSSGAPRAGIFISAGVKKPA